MVSNKAIMQDIIDQLFTFVPSVGALAISTEFICSTGNEAQKASSTEKYNTQEQDPSQKAPCLSLQLLLTLHLVKDLANHTAKKIQRAAQEGWG